MDVLLLLVTVCLLVGGAFYLLVGRETSSTRAEKVSVTSLRPRKSDALDDSDAEDSADNGAAGEGGSDDDNNNDDDEDDDDTNLTRLQRRKKQKERERRERREAVAAAEGARQQRAESHAERERRREQMEAERAAKEEAALQELRDEKKRQDEAEYARWVGEMEVEQRGELGDEARQKHARVVALLTSRAAAVAQGRKNGTENGEPRPPTKSKSVLVLQDAAREAGVTVPELVAVMEQLLKDETITGVFDDRGKFVFVSDVHFQHIARFMKLRGRVSVSELARECNKVIMEA